MLNDGIKQKLVVVFLSMIRITAHVLGEAKSYYTEPRHEKTGFLHMR